MDDDLDVVNINIKLSVAWIMEQPISIPSCLRHGGDNNDFDDAGDVVPSWVLNEY